MNINFIYKTYFIADIPKYVDGFFAVAAHEALISKNSQS